MARKIRLDGDTWSVRLSKHPPGPGMQAVVFHPVTCDQRPYRVVEVPEETLEGATDMEAMSERELRELFDGSSSMGFPREYA